jgi:hypothetical protein
MVVGACEGGGAKAVGCGGGALRWPFPMAQHAAAACGSSYTHTHTHRHTYTHTHTHTHIRLYLSIYAYTHTHTHATSGISNRALLLQQVHMVLQACIAWCFGPCLRPSVRRLSPCILVH